MTKKKTVAKKQARMSSSEEEKNFVFPTGADLTEAGYGFLHEFSDWVRHLYLLYWRDRSNRRIRPDAHR
jgi:hypothetical protein